MKADLHVHTFYSFDACSSPREIVETALEKNIDCLCICDHNEIKGAKEVLDYAFSKPLLIIPGIEVRSREGDILGLNVKKKIPSGLSAKETILKIRKVGGMAVIAHPFDWFWLAFNFNGFENFNKEIIDAIEVFNASVWPFGNKKAWDFAQKFSLPFIAGSDAHCPEMIGKAYLLIEKENLSIEGVLEEIRKRNVKIGGKEASLFEKIEHSFKMSFETFKCLAGKKTR